MKRDEQDLRPQALESASHHEECLEAALVDMKNHFTPIPNYDPEACFGWAQINAQKHFEALISLPGYRMPSWLARMSSDIAGLE